MDDQLDWAEDDRLAPRPRQIRESKRLRDLWRYFPQDLRGPTILDTQEGAHNDSLPLHYPPLDFIPRPSTDTALTSFAQLGTLRIGVSRAFVTLLDDSNQYILAEATPKIPLRANRKLEAGKSLWLGNSTIPSYLSICKLLWDTPYAYDRAIIINDIRADPRFAQNVLFKDSPMRFYAGVPLCSPGGAVIGSYCIYGDKPRENGINEEELILMEDVAATVMEHFEMYRLLEDQRRSEQMIKGLTGFIGGDSFIPGTKKAYTQAFLDASGTVKFDLTKTYQRPPLHNMSSYTDPEVQNMGSATDVMRSAGRSASYQSDADDDVAVDSNLKEAHPASAVPSDFRSRGSSPGKRQKVTQSGIDIAMQAESAPHAHSVPQQPIKKSSLQESILPPEAREMFSRAANVLRESSGLDGVVIFDASIAAFNQSRAKRNSQVVAHSTGTPIKAAGDQVSPGQEEEPSSSDTSSSSGALPEGKAVCQILGFSDPVRSSTAGDEPQLKYLSLAEHSLRRMLKAYATGRILNFNQSGEFTTSDDSDTTIKQTHEDTGAVVGSGSLSRKARKEERLRSIIDAIQQIAPDATSIAFVPLWDYERSRWFACALCWTHKTDRILSPEVDLLYMKAFGNSIMTELARLDAKLAVKAKTTFVASISHELRSPLHGILGSSEFLGNTRLDPFQMSMLHSITTCGRTLLDTLDHIMDFAKINEITDHKSRSVTQLRGSNAVRISSNPTKGRNVAEMSKLATTFDLSRVTEEVVESVFASQSYGIPYSGLNEDSSSAGFVSSSRNRHASSRPAKKRKLVLVVLDIPPQPNWSFHLPAGVWRRIVMNLVGNALKYTETGFIRISIDANKSAPKLHSKETQITLSVRDSGIGMSTDFLANKLFSAFSQENDLSSGVGLGLHIVRQLTETVGGRIDFQSQAGVGTEVTVKLALMRGDTAGDTHISDFSIADAKAKLSGRKVCIVDTLSASSEASFGDVPPEFGPQHFGSGPQQIVREIEKTLKGWLDMDVVVTEDWQDHDSDFIICTEPSFTHLENIRARTRGVDKAAPVTIFLTLDAIEASALRNDARVLSKESVVEICPQPCGPYKLAKLLDTCFERYLFSNEVVALPKIDQVFQSSQELAPSTRRSPLPPIISATSLNDNLSPLMKPVDAPPASFRRPSSHLSAQTQILRSHSTSRDQSPASLNGDRFHVLIADDNLINRRILIAFMKRWNYSYDEAENGKMALEIYSETPTRFSLVLMDLSMPIMDGMSSTRAIRMFEKRESLRRVPIIALTGLAFNSTRLEAYESGMDHYLTKPVNFKSLAEIIESNLGPERGGDGSGEGEEMERKKSVV